MKTEGDAVIVTKHAQERLKERMGVNKQAGDRLAKIAMEKGLTHAETNGRLKSLLDDIFLKHKTANNMRIYSEKVFLFHDEILITVLPLDQEYKRIALKLCKRKKENEA
jgi:hypothetical protein